MSRRSKTLIYTAYLSNLSLLSSYSIISPIGNSDQKSILITLTRLKHLKQNSHRTIWNYARADWDALDDKLLYLPSSTDDVDSSWLSWKYHFLSAVSHHIPSSIAVKKVFHGLHLLFSSFYVNVIICFLNSNLQIETRFGSNIVPSEINLFLHLERPSLPSFQTSHPCCTLQRISGKSITHSLSLKNVCIPPQVTDDSVTAVSTVSKATLLNCHFTSCYSSPSSNNGCSSSEDSSPIDTPHSLSSIYCSQEEVFKLLSTMKKKTASGPGGVSSRMLRYNASASCTTLTDLFNFSLSSSVVPSEWKLSDVNPFIRIKVVLILSLVTDQFLCFPFFKIVRTYCPQSCHASYCQTICSPLISLVFVLVVLLKKHSCMLLMFGTSI